MQNILTPDIIYQNIDEYRVGNLKVVLRFVITYHPA